MTVLLWLRRDLRCHDHPALVAAQDASPSAVAPVFIWDESDLAGRGRKPRAWLAANVLAVDAELQGQLTLRSGDPLEVIPQVAQAVGASEVHVSTDPLPAGQQRDARVREALAERGIGWVETGSPYAITPGRVRTNAGGGYHVFTPFLRAWREHGWPQPAVSPGAPQWVSADSDAGLREQLTELVRGVELPVPGEAGARERWDQFLAGSLEDYADDRDRADVDGTSVMSPYLAVGAVHPRTLLADLVRVRTEVNASGVAKFESELAWREFYADVVWHNGDALHRDIDARMRGMPYDADDELVEAWQQGRTGYPIVDAAQRQLAAIGWVHNRARMITASFLTKDLHAWWPVGADHFLEHLIDGDPASNSLGWQWVAGTGTDAAPYFRVFNPTRQGLRFDPDGNYVRRWVPELRHLPGKSVHEPWRHPDGYCDGYPQRIVDHDAERKVALARYELARQAR